MNRLKSPKNVRRVLRKTCGDCYYFRLLRETEPEIENVKGCIRPEAKVQWEQGDLDIFAEQFYTVCDRFRFN